MSIKEKDNSLMQRIMAKEIQKKPTGRRDSSGKPDMTWNMDIPYSQLINHHTTKQVTPEQIEAAKYFVSEEVEASRRAFGHKKPKEVALDHRIRAKLVYTTDLEKMVEEYKKENSDPEYKNMKQKERYEQNLLECQLLRGGRTVS